MARASSRSRSRAVLFDIGGTLARPRVPLADLLVQVVRAAGSPVSAAAASTVAERLEHELADRALSGEPFTFPPDRSREHWLSLYRFCLKPICLADVRERVAQEVFARLSSPLWYELYPDALPTLKRLRRAGLRLGVVSNWEAWLPQLLDQLQLSELLTCVVASGTAAVEKPDPMIFELALAAADMQARDVVYVGDNVRDDVEGAAGAGLQPVLLDRAGRWADFTSAPVIRSLDELPDLLAT